MEHICPKPVGDAQLLVPTGWTEYLGACPDTCYVDCTKKCLPTCVAGTSAEGDYDTSALTAAAEKSTGLSYLAHSGVPTSGAELLSTVPPRMN